MSTILRAGMVSVSGMARLIPGITFCIFGDGHGIKTDRVLGFCKAVSAGSGRHIYCSSKAIRFPMGGCVAKRVPLESLPVPGFGLSMNIWATSRL